MSVEEAAAHYGVTRKMVQFRLNITAAHRRVQRAELGR
jgi:hypothetical protein